MVPACACLYSGILLPERFSKDKKNLRVLLVCCTGTARGDPIRTSEFCSTGTAQGLNSTSIAGPRPWEAQQEPMLHIGMRLVYRYQCI